MASLPVFSGREAVKAFEKIGFIFHRQKGSHMILYMPMGGISQFPTIESLTAEPCGR
jgi:predicted RNA binding protein YcfA (HicA-like mRNA interferase family)